MAKPLKPRAEGVTYSGPALDLRTGRIVRHKLPLTPGCRALTELDMAFFTPAILYLYGGFTDAPFVDYMLGLGRDVRIFEHVFSKPVFVGLIDAKAYSEYHWNYTLWAVDAPDAKGLGDHLCSVATADSKKKTFTRVGQQELVIPDPLARERDPANPQTLRITAFGLDGSEFQAGFLPGARGLPGVVKQAPSDALVAQAAALFKNIS